MVVEIDDEVVIARDTERGTNTTFARFELGAGFHRIAVRYQQYAGGLGLHVFVARAGDVPSRIDPESLFPVEPTPGQMGANQRLRVLRRTAMAAWFVPALAFLLWTQGPRTVRAARRSLRACLQRHGVNWRRMSIDAPASEPRSMDAPRRTSAIGKGLCAIAVAGFLAGILQFYDATTGFTSLIGFGEQFEEGALDIVWDTPHYVYPRSSGYDGQFYAQLALDPLLRNPDLRDAMDSASYRSRRILFSWTAFVLGMGRPVWILQVFAVQNIISWLLLGWLLRRWLPPVNVRNWLAWCGCMFGYGSIISVRYALTEGPSMVLIALGIVAVERRRSGIAAGIVGLSGLGRETNLLAAVAVGRRMMPAMGTIGVWVKIILLAAGPLTLWLAYTSLVYGPGVWSGEDNVTPPLSGLVQNWTITVRQIRMEGLGSAGYRSLMAMLAVIVQVVYLGWRGDWHLPWWRLGIVYAGLMTVIGFSVWEGSPGAFVRLLLPMTVAFNVLLPQSRWFWPLFALGNLTLVQGVETLWDGL